MRLRLTLLTKWATATIREAPMEASGHPLYVQERDVTESDSECMPLDDCRRLLTELQELRLRLTTLEQSVADFVNSAEGEPE